MTEKDYISGLISGRGPERYFYGPAGPGDFHSFSDLSRESPEDLRARMMLALAQERFGKNPQFASPEMQAVPDPLQRDPQTGLERLQRAQGLDAGIEGPDSVTKALDVLMTLFQTIGSMAHPELRHTDYPRESNRRFVQYGQR